VSRAVAVLLVLLACACSGGGDVRPDPPTQPPVLRTDLLLGYYFGDAASAVETADHANLYWATYAYGEAEQVRGLTLARAAGQKVVLMLTPGIGELEVRAYLARLAAADLLRGIVAVYDYDEPDVNGQSEELIIATNAMLRSELAKHQEVAGAALAVIYACGENNRPGIASFDWIGCDDYNLGCGALVDGVDRMRAAMRPEQRVMLVPGGASPWQQDPACFVAYAHANPQVVAIVGFLWQSEGQTIGIRDNGMSEIYSTAGRKLLTTTQEKTP